MGLKKVLDTMSKNLLSDIEQTKVDQTFFEIPEVPKAAFRLGPFACRAEDAFQAAHVLSLVNELMATHRSFDRWDLGELLSRYAEKDNYEDTIKELQDWIKEGD